MIFVTVGTQLGFDRLIEAIDEWACINADIDIFAQIGASTYIPKNLNWCKNLNNAEFRSKAIQSSIIVSHGGMGTILTAMDLEKPLILVPRYADKGEHRNNHQVATCKKFARCEGIKVAWQVDELIEILNSGDYIVPLASNESAANDFSVALKIKINDMLGLPTQSKK